MTPKMVFHLSMTRTGSEAVLDSRRLKLWGDVQEYVASVGIKQTLQQTCFTRKRKLRSKF